MNIEDFRKWASDLDELYEQVNDMFSRGDFSLEDVMRIQVDMMLIMQAVMFHIISRTSDA